jgi:hypothetical protein
MWDWDIWDIGWTASERQPERLNLWYFPGAGDLGENLASLEGKIDRKP